MRVDHRISVAGSADVRDELARFGIDVADAGLVTFVLSESDPRWPDVAPWVVRTRAADVVTSHFTKGELADAPWLELVTDWFHGYPLPDDDFGYRNVTYDSSAFCPACGVGLRQVAPFRMAREPRWGKRSLLQLNWIFDEFFALPAVQQETFGPFGVGAQEVLDARGARLDTVVQLAIPDEASIDTEGLLGVQCPQCGATKYAYPYDEPSPRLLEAPDGVHLLRSDAWFGSGAEAHRLIFVSQDLAEALRAAKIRGASLRPATRTAGIQNRT